MERCTGKGNILAFYGIVILFFPKLARYLIHNPKEDPLKYTQLKRASLI